MTTTTTTTTTTKTAPKPTPTLPLTDQDCLAETLACNARSFVPDAGRARGVYLHIHGGGWAFGSADGQDERLRGIAEKARRDPELPPLYADLTCMPPARIAVGTEDPLLDDFLFLARR